LLLSERGGYNAGLGEKPAIGAFAQSPAWDDFQGVFWKSPVAQTVDFWRFLKDDSDR
jgi:hypothetical protein